MGDVQLNAQSLVTTSATTSPASGTSESWAVSALAAGIPALSTPGTYTLVDATSGATAQQQAEIIRVTACTGSGATSITVTRGADGTTPVAHAATSTFNLVPVSSYFQGLAPNLLPAYAQGLGLQGRFDPRNSMYGLANSCTHRFRAGCGRVAANAGNLHILAFGDSSLIGYNGTSYVSANALPRQLGIALAAALGGTYAGGIWPAVTAGGTSAGDLWSLSGGADVTTNKNFQTAAATGGGTYTSPHVGTAGQLFYFDGSGSFSWTVDGVGQGTVTMGGTNTIKSTTPTTGLTSATHTVGWAWVSGTVKIAAAWVKPTGSTGLVFVHNLAQGGAFANRTPAGNNWSDTSTSGLQFSATGIVTASGITVDFLLVSVGNNDVFQGSANSSTITGIQTLLGLYTATADSLFTHAWMVPSTNATNFAALGGLKYSLADQLGVPLWDWNNVVGGQATAQTDGMLGADNTHPIDGTSILAGKTLAAALAA